MTPKTPRQRRVMRKAIKMARAGQIGIAHARVVHAQMALNGLNHRSPEWNARMTRCRRAIDLLAAIEDVRLIPPEVMMLRALKRAGRRLNARHA